MIAPLRPGAVPLQVTLAVDVLDALCRAAKTLKDRNATITLTFQAPTDAKTNPWAIDGRPGYVQSVGVTLRTDDGSEVTGAAMPFRL